MTQRNDDACRKKFAGTKMVNTTKKQATEVTRTPKNRVVQKAISAGKNAKAAKREVSQHSSKDRLKWLREMRKLQDTTNLLMKKAPFQRLVRELIANINPYYHVQANAVMALHEAAESFLLQLFEFCNYIAIHAK